MPAVGAGDVGVMMRAYRIYVRGWGSDPQSLTIASSRSRAIAKNLRSAQDAGYGLKWTDLRAIRSPEHDGMFAKHGAFSWSWDHAQEVVDRMLSAAV